VDKKKKEAAEAASATAKATFTLNTGYVKWMAVENKNTWRYQTHIDSRISFSKRRLCEILLFEKYFCSCQLFLKVLEFQK